MLTDTILFYIFALLVLGGGVLTITRRSAVHSAISLIVSLLGVAGLYLLQQAEFLFAVQIVLYVGGIMVLFLFVIMLVNLDEAAKERQFNRQWLIALVGGGRGRRAGRLLHLSRARTAFQFAAPVVAGTPAGLGNTEADCRLAVLASTCCRLKSPRVLLLVAVVGSVVMAKKRI